MKEMNRRFLKWFDRNKRDLPWRKSKDPYLILLSELMLQQTTVRAVIPYFEKFRAKFPNIRSMALASEEDVLALWSGLGYYSRARNLHKLAKQVADTSFPDKFDALIDLPGIGPYTAAAIASIAFGERVGAVDGNVLRVFSRIFDLSDDISKPQTRKKIFELAQRFQDSLQKNQNAGDLNQAWIELGATVCIPKKPACVLCPVSTSCQSLKNGTVELRPIKNKKLIQTPWLWELHIGQKKGKYLLVKGENGTPWVNHLWTFPGHARPLKKAPAHFDFKHSITTHQIFVKMINKNGAIKRQKGIQKWISSDKIHGFGVSSVVTKALHLIEKDMS